MKVGVFLFLHSCLTTESDPSTFKSLSDGFTSFTLSDKTRKALDQANFPWDELSNHGMSEIECSVPLCDVSEQDRARFRTLGWAFVPVPNWITSHEKTWRMHAVKQDSEDKILAPILSQEGFGQLYYWVAGNETRKDLEDFQLQKNISKNTNEEQNFLKKSKLLFELWTTCVANQITEGSMVAQAAYMLWSGPNFPLPLRSHKDSNIIYPRLIRADDRIIQAMMSEKSSIKMAITYAPISDGVIVMNQSPNISPEPEMAAVLRNDVLHSPSPSKDYRVSINVFFSD